MNDPMDLAKGHPTRLLGRVRKARIVEMIRTRGSVSSSALAAEFGVSDMTVRRDLAELDTQGKLLRTHGGAVPPDRPGTETSEPVEPFFDDRSARNQEAKRRIAATAQRLVHKGQAVALDVGTTTYELAVCLATRTGIKVFTNNLRVAALLGTSHSSEIYLLGGRLRHNEMSLCGPVAVQQAKKLTF